MPVRRCAAFLTACSPALFLVTGAAAQSPPPPYVVLGAQGPVARVILTPDANNNVASCPRIEVDGAAKDMIVRAEPDGGKFNIRVCEFVLQGAKRATIAGQTLPLPPDSIASIAVFGDTGCRVKGPKSAGATAEADEADEADEANGKAASGKYQDCQTDWPFQTMSETIAAIKPKPDLVIHVGDYLYRESACDDHPGCEGPHGYNWPTWDADFFKPAAALLQAVPWIVARGNHEICTRAGFGYALMLDPTPFNPDKPPKCDPHDPPLDQYTVSVGGRSFIVLDSSAAPDNCPTGCDSGWYEDQFAAMKPATGTWLVTHRPIWGFTYSKDKKTGERELGIRNMTLQAALAKKWKNVPPAGIELVLSGHIHLWEALSFADGRTPQFVLGAGGTELSHKLPKDKDLKGQEIGGTTIAAIASDEAFGYTLFEPSRHGGRWGATFYDPAGKENIACKVETGQVTCK